MGSIAGEIEDILRSIAIIHRIISVNPVVFYPPRKYFFSIIVTRNNTIGDCCYSSGLIVTQNRSDLIIH